MTDASVRSRVLERRVAALEPMVVGRTIVLKLGGSVGREDTLPVDALSLQRLGARLVLVHGGGPQITAWLARIRKETRFVGGLRYTDEETLDVVRMVLGGLVNGAVVAQIGAAGGRAVGLTGADDGLLEAEATDPDLGLVGEVTAVRADLVRSLLDAGYIVVVAPLAVSRSGSFLNVNADTAAGAIAVALGADRLVFFTDVDGVRDEKGAVRRSLDAQEAQRLMDCGAIDGGMIPKMVACLRVLGEGRSAQIVDGRRPHALIHALGSPGEVGTTLTPASLTPASAS